LGTLLCYLVLHHKKIKEEQVTDAEVALHLIRSRRKSEEAQRDSCAAHGSYSTASTHEGIAVGLLIAEKILVEECKLQKMED